MPHDLQPGDYAYWKRHNLKDYLQTEWKDPYQVLFFFFFLVVQTILLSGILQRVWNLACKSRKIK